MVGTGSRREEVRHWLLQVGTEPVDLGDETSGLDDTDSRHGVVAWVVLGSEVGAPSDLPCLVVTAETTRTDMVEFTRGFKHKEDNPARQLGDDHGSARSWPRGSY